MSGVASDKVDFVSADPTAWVIALSTLFNNLEAEHLKRLLPFFLHYLVDRATQNSSDPQSLPAAFEEFLDSIDLLINTRREIQSSRVKSDLQIFIEAGHPLGFLASADWNEIRRRELEWLGLAIDFDCGDAGELKRELRRLIAAVHLKYAEQTAFENQRLRREVTRLQNESQRLSVEIERRSTDAARLAEERESLAQELRKIKSSRGWRVLSRYGRIKYRYLLPIYRLLGLGESESAASESARRRQSQEPPSPVSPAPASAISEPVSGRTTPQSDRTMMRSRWNDPVRDQNASQNARTAPISSNHISDARPLAVGNRFEGYRSHRGYCNVCGSHTAFFYRDEGMYRESLTCAECLTTSRYRSIARGVLRAVSELRGVDVPSLERLKDMTAGRPASAQAIAKLRVYDTQSPFYLPISAYPLPDLLSKSGWIEVQTSLYKPELPLGAELGENISNQNLETLSFDNESFDIVITSDVMEHVRLDGLAHREISRVLKPGGVYLFTVPHFRHKRETLIRVAAPDPSDSSKDVFILTKEYHGDANSESGRALAYRTYGLDLDEKLQELGFTVDYECRDYPEAGILNTELFFCRFKQV